jgi:hypothetical protein
MNMRTALESLVLLLLSGTAIAGDLQAVPEPGIAELLAVGAIAAGLIFIRKRRR